MPIPSSDDSRPDTVNNSHGSRRISREIANLQQEIRDDFDQKLRELSGLMVKFRSLLANDGQLGSDLPRAANDATLEDKEQNSPDRKVVQFLDKNVNDAAKDIPVLTDRVNDDANSQGRTGFESDKRAAILKLVADNSDRKAEDTSSQVTSADSSDSGASSSQISRFATEPARFESGLYQLNSQLYRFKLELDQELEYREEPLHIHFQHQSDLAKVLQQITEKMQQEKNIGH